VKTWTKTVFIFSGVKQMNEQIELNKKKMRERAEQIDR
jgi:hypothetical protein